MKKIGEVIPFLKQKLTNYLRLVTNYSTNISCRDILDEDIPEAKYTKV
jgi:hypothetical protein